MDDLLARALGRVIRRAGLQTLLSLLLLLVALGTVAFGLSDLIRGLEASLLVPIAAFGVLLGWLLAKPPLPGWLGGILAFGLGSEALLLHLGRLVKPLMALLKSLAELAWRGLRWPVAAPAAGPPDGSLPEPALAELGTNFSTLLSRVRDWSLALIRGQAAFDPVPTALVWGLALWMAAFWASWAVRRRHRTLQGIAPAGALLATSLSYTWDQPYPLWVLLGATLLLMVVTGHIARERRWQASGTDFSPELRFDLALAGILLSLVVLTLAFLTPSISVRPIVRFTQRLLVEHLRAGKQVADSMGLEPLAGEGIALSQAQAAGLPTRSLIGSGPELSEQVVMLVELEGPQSVSETSVSPPNPEPPRYYWRALTYDIYTGRGWVTGETETVTYRAGEPSILRVGSEGKAGTSPAVHRVLRQKVQAVADVGGLLHRSGELVTADQDFRIAWRSSDDAFGAEIDAKVYRADSLVPFVSQAQLRTAGDDYPQWVRDRYLALPPEVPSRVRSLARELTAAESTPYDRARTIEHYLRTFTYTLDLPAPPPNREIVDYFLFDLKQGYCDYYATAMVVLARAAGLPARLVAGYASGAFDEEAARYIVTAADKHSWVEIYFPDNGWVEFEPTGGRPSIERPVEIAPTELAETQTALEPLTDQRITPGKLIRPSLLGGLALLLLGGAAWWFADSWRLRNQPPEEAIGTLYQRLHRHGRRLAVPAKAGDTPFEFAAAVGGRVTELAVEGDSDAALKSVSQQLHWLTSLYVRGRYSPHKPNEAEKTQAIQTWRRLRQQLWRVWIRHKRNGERRRA